MCYLPFSVDASGGGEMIARELFDPLPLCLFFLWATYDLKQYIHIIKKEFISIGSRDTLLFLANMISAAAREKASGRDKDNNSKKGKFIKGCIRKIERERQNIAWVNSRHKEEQEWRVCVCMSV